MSKGNYVSSQLAHGYNDPLGGQDLIFPGFSFCMVPRGLPSREEGHVSLQEDRPCPSLKLLCSSLPTGHLRDLAWLPILKAMPTSFSTPIWPGHRCSMPPGALSSPQVLKPQGLCKAQSRAPSMYTPLWHSWLGTHPPVTSAQEADKWSLLPEAQAPVPHRIPDISSWVRVGISTRCPKTLLLL